MSATPAPNDEVPTDASRADASRESDARAAGRGGLFVLGAKVFFIAIGFVQQALLQAAIGLSDYGALARVLAPANIVNNVVVQGSIQGVSRRVAPVRDRFLPELRAALRVHVPLAFVVAATFALAAWPIAAFQRAPHIETPLRVMAVVALAYGVYAPLIGSLNGRALFGKQALLDVLFATFRTAGLVGVGFLFVRQGLSGTMGATVGFAAAALLIAPIAATWAFRGAPAAGESSNAANGTASAVSALSGKTYLIQLASVAVAQVLMNALMQIDLALVGRFLSESAHATLADPAVARKQADEWVGVYRACQLFAFLPYQLVLSVAQVLFPMVARAHAAGDREQVRAVVVRGLRIAALLAGGLVAIVATLPGTLLHFAYGTVVAARGAEALRVLALGQGAFALFGVASTFLVSLGRERTSALLSGVALTFVATTCALLASRGPFGGSQIASAALATSMGLGAALVVMSFVLRRAAGGFAPVVTLLRAGLSILACAAIGTQIPTLSRTLAPIAAAAVFALYVGLLVVSRELGKADVDGIAGILRRRRKR